MSFKPLVCLVLLAAVAMVAATGPFSSKPESNLEEPCCKSCQLPQVMYYSIDNIFHMCGECCIDPKNEWIFKIFEPGLTLAKDLTPCQENGYPFYNSTVIHGVAPISMTLDLYVKSN